MSHEEAVYGGFASDVINCKFKYFEIYSKDNKFASVKEALESLREHLPLDIEKLYDTTVLTKDEMISNQPLLSHGTDKEKKYYHLYCHAECCDDLLNNGHRLFNSHLLENDAEEFGLRPVFVVDRFRAADRLEFEIKRGYIDSLLEELKRAQKEFYDPYAEYEDYTKFPVEIGFTKTAEDIDPAFAEVKWRALHVDRSSPALGDAIVVAPVGGYVVPQLSDWSLLAKRDIYIFELGICDEQKCIRDLMAVTESIYHDLIMTQDGFSMEKLHYVIMDRKRAIDVDGNDIRLWQINDLLEKIDAFDIEILEDMHGLYDEYCRRYKKKRHSNKYVVEPFLREKEWMLLSGEEGSGKSYMAMALGTAIATKGKLPFGWKTHHRNCKVLYIADDEMSGYIDERFAVFKKMYPRLNRSFFYKTVHRIDLLNEGDRARIDGMICEYSRIGNDGAVNVLIFDHLNKLTRERGAKINSSLGDSAPDWRTVRDWIEELGRRGITVILLHHEYTSTGKMLGSRILGNDAPAHLSMKKVDQLEADSVEFSVAIVKNKGGASSSKTSKIRLNLKSHKWEDVSDDDAPQQVPSSQTPFRMIPKDEREKRIKELRQAGRTGKEIAAVLGCSESSIQKIISRFAPDDKMHPYHGRKK